MQTVKILRWISPLLVAVVWVGCDGQSDSGGAAATAPPSEEALVVLAKADAADGVEDKVVNKCLTCSLGMEGKAEQTSTFGPYELHLCSAACKKRFDADPEKAVLAVTLPAAPE